MTEEDIHNKTFERIEQLNKGEYEKCVFNHCNFSEADLSDFKFIDCSFYSCNLSLCRLNKTALRTVTFKDCKLLGLRFDTCHAFGFVVKFESCLLNHSIFFKTNLKNCAFKDVQLEECDFTEADLSGVKLDNCNLLNAMFDRTILEKTDLRTAYNYIIDPENNRIKKAKFSASGIAGLLQQYDISIEP